MTEDWLDKSPPEMRLALWLSDRLDTGDDTNNIERLAQELGYSRDTVVKMWINSQAKVPLKHISPIARFLGVDIADILPYWLCQECPDDGHLYSAGSRMLSVWEHLLISTARDIYAADED